MTQEYIKEQVGDIVTHISDYQTLVDRNRETAKEMGDWGLRVNIIRGWLKKLGYKL